MNLPILIVLVIVCPSLELNLPIVNTVLGKVKGTHKLSHDGRIYSVFEGIPYAKPPLGDLRFREPEDPDPWLGVLEGDKKHLCVQNPMSDLIFGDEDCLYLNVFVPRENPIPNENLDVIVHIHAGAYIGGSPELAGPAYLMDRDIIYVHFNYRVGALGYLSTEDDVVSGNMGMKDQVKALQWVQNNIKYFGGNPNSVTIVGASAGSSSVHLHYFSPLSKGLFHKGILQGGTALAPWSLQVRPLDKAIKLGNAVNCSYTTSELFINCLREKSASELTSQSRVLHAVDLIPLCPFGPVIEKPSKTAFLVDAPQNLLLNGNFNKLPLLNSIASDEGLLYFTLTKMEALEDHWDEFLPYILEYIDSTKPEDLESVSQKIKDFYFPDGKITQAGIVKLYGDRIFEIPYEMTSRIHAKASDAPVYAIVYGYYTSFKEPATNIPEGVTHGEDSNIIYDSVIKIKNKPDKFVGMDAKIKDFYVDIFSSFAKNGIPKHADVDWKPVSGNEDLEYLLIEKDGNIKMKSKQEFGPKDFWFSLPIYHVHRIDILKDEL